MFSYLVLLIRLRTSSSVLILALVMSIIFCFFAFSLMQQERQLKLFKMKSSTEVLKEKLISTVSALFFSRYTEESIIFASSLFTTNNKLARSITIWFYEYMKKNTPRRPMKECCNPPIYPKISRVVYAFLSK